MDSSSRVESRRATPDLLTFKETFSFKSYVKESLMDNSIYGSFDCDEVISQSARIVGQERDGSILMAWDAPRQGTEKIVTHVGVYSPLSPSHRTIYTHESQIDICGATIDSERTLLAFTIREKQPIGLNYDTYVAEINPCNRVFSLNLSSNDFRKLQFIHNRPRQSSGHKNAKLNTSHLLVVIPDNWVCLYSFQLEPAGKGYTVVNQPDRIMVANELPWYQWDPQRQWLSYARFSSTPQQLPTNRKNPTDNIIILHVVDFSGTAHNVILTFSIPLSHSQRHYTESASYFVQPLAFSLPVHELNLKVLHNEEGLWCVCLQHSDGRSISSHSQKKTSAAKKEPKIEYSVYVLHNGHILEGEASLQNPSDEGYHIQFLLFGNFVVAYVPQIMLHILNVGTQTDPCHHLILEGQYAPPIPVSADHEPTDIRGRRVLGAAVGRDLELDNSCSVIDPFTSVFYSCQLDSKAFLTLFMSTTDPQMKESLLHLALVGLREYSIGLHMIEHVCQTPLTLEDPKLFQEFLLALTYSRLYQDCPKFLAHHLPLTGSICYRGNIYKSLDGKKYALLRCVGMIDFFKQLLVQSDQKLVSPSCDFLIGFNTGPSDPLQELCFNAVLNQPHIYRRLNLIEISSQVSALAMSTPPAARKASSLKKAEKTSDFVDKIKILLHSQKSPHGQASPNASVLPFLLPDEDLAEFSAIRNDLFKGRLLHTLSMQMRLQSKNGQAQVSHLVNKYISEIQRSSQILLQVIWQSLNFSSENHPLQASLHRQPSLEEEALFELLESYYLIHLDIGIQPPTGFMTLFICMGYLCLEPSVFVNYLRNKVFTPTKYFLDLLFYDFDGVDDDFLFEILSHIDEETRMSTMKRWKNPTLDLWLLKHPPSKQPTN